MNIEANITESPINIIEPSSTDSNSWKMIMAVVIIIILAVLGLNIFVYLAKGTDLVTYVLEKIGTLMKYITQQFGKGTGRALDLTKVGITEVAGTSQEKKDLDTTLDKKKVSVENTASDVEANSTDAKKIQSGNKKGWCYVGADRDYRSCLKVNADDTCTSGEIYDSKQQCEHPELRYD